MLFTDNKIENINSRDILVLNKTYVFVPFLIENKSINNSLEFTSIVNINKLNNSLELNITNESNNSLKLDLLFEVTTMINQLTNSLELNKSIELIPAVSEFSSCKLFNESGMKHRDDVNSSIFFYHIIKTVYDVRS